MKHAFAFIISRYDHRASGEAAVIVCRNRFVTEIEQGLPCEIKNVCQNHQKAERQEDQIHFIVEEERIGHAAGRDVDQQERDGDRQQGEEPDHVADRQLAGGGLHPAESVFQKDGGIFPCGVQTLFHTVAEPLQRQCGFP